MIKEIIASGKDIIEAKENARAALGAGPLDDVNFEVIHAGSRGIFGIIGVKPAQVRAFIEIPDPVERRSRHDRPKKNKADRPHEEKKNNNNSNNQPKHHSNKPKEEKKPEAEKVKTQAIPEAELNLTLKEVNEGEDMSFDFVNTVIKDIGLDAVATLYSCDDGTRRITITGEDASTLIGHHGDTLDALQYLANLASAKKNVNGERDKSRVTIDIEGYRAKREETLRALARRMAAKALRNRRSVMLEPMTPYERRIIHSEIQNIEGVSTNSVGSDNNRKIVIYLTDKKPEGIFEEEDKVETATATEEAVIEEAAVEAADSDVTEE
ncbi:MAG: Jag N-terminal domain-containing protein [Clostridia bacterium]|nr:Jag N-terminal domain-containing protein [Clostridia bacterium]